VIRFSVAGLSAALIFGIGASFAPAAPAGATTPGTTTVSVDANGNLHLEDQAGNWANLIITSNRRVKINGTAPGRLAAGNLCTLTGLGLGPLTYVTCFWSSNSLSANMKDGGDTLHIDSGLNVNTFVYMESGDDHYSGGPGNDEVYGQAGQDTLDGGAGNDSLHGGDDGDTLIGGNAGSDILDGSNGTDIGFYVSAPTSLVGDIGTPGPDGNRVIHGSDRDSLVSIESLVGSRNADRLSATGATGAMLEIAGYYGTDELTSFGNVKIDANEVNNFDPQPQFDKDRIYARNGAYDEITCENATAPITLRTNPGDLVRFCS
jgi:hypothetical protein